MNNNRRNKYIYNAVVRWTSHCEWAKKYCIKNKIPYHEYFPKNEGEEAFLYSRIETYRGTHKPGVKTTALRYLEVDEIIQKYGFYLWLSSNEKLCEKEIIDNWKERCNLCLSYCQQNKLNIKEFIPSYKDANKQIRNIGYNLSKYCKERNNNIDKCIQDNGLGHWLK